MGSAIFQTKEVIKKDLYDFIKSLFVDAGWKNISSNQDYTTNTADGDVFHSNGKKGDRELYFCMRPTTSAGANDIRTTNFCHFSYRHTNRYVPSEIEGVNGAYTMTTAWVPTVILPVAATAGYNMNLKVFCTYYSDKNRVIFALTYPHSLNYDGVVTYIGIPDEPDIFAPIPNNNVFVMTTALAQAANAVYAASRPAVLGAVTGASLSTYHVITGYRGDPNLDGSKLLSKIAYGSDILSYLGLISDVYLTGQHGALTGDLLKQEQANGEIHTYKFIKTGELNNSSVGGHSVALRIS